MSLLIAGLVLFLGVHTVAMVRPLRASVVKRVGEDPYKGLFSLVSLTGLVAMIYGKYQAPFAHLYVTPSWGHSAALWLMPVALLLLIAAYLPGHLRRVLGHPMLLGIGVWATAHLLANGDLASVLLFGGFLLFALADLISHLFRPERPERPAYLWADGVAVLAAVLDTVLVLYLHGLAGHPVVSFF